MIKTFCTMMALGLTIVWTGAVNAQWVDHEVVTRVISGTGGTVAAQGETPAVLPAARDDGTPQKKALIGSWVETVTFESGRPPLKSLVTFHDDGTMLTSDQGSVTTEPPGVFTSGHGAWVGLEKRTSAYTLLELISDLSGNLVAYLKVRGVYTVSQSGTEYTGTSFFQVFDTSGKLLDSGDVTNAGRRITIELP